MSSRKFLAAFFVLSAALTAAPLQANAADKSAKQAKVYDEEEFVSRFSHKSMKQVSDAVGKPVRTAQASKPTTAEDTIGRKLDNTQVAKVEMWYYQNLVRYDKKHTYKTIELTFVNDRCMNIAFFN